MKFGIYVHIPYCLQRCTYCDFATYERSKIFPSNEYVSVLEAEITQRANYFGPRPLDTLYFGGGTPSLLPPQEILTVIRSLAKHGYKIQPHTEVTIEINPATIDDSKLRQYLDMGFNRFSVGAQTFDDRLLKMVHREHNARQTVETLELLSSKNLNFSFDLLFALPTQTLEGVREDVRRAIELGASHLSPYCLTVPEGHPLSKGRAPEDEQVEMFELIFSQLESAGFLPYEISNFAKPGFEAQHNLLYWTDEEYWGLGLSAHSYKKSPPWGTRFWNVSNINEYRTQIERTLGQTFDSPNHDRSEEDYEILKPHQSLTDFCHTSLRLMKGLSLPSLTQKFPEHFVKKAQERLDSMVRRQLLTKTDKGDGTYALTRSGLVVSNRVFAEMTFLSEDV